jgi:hypothetical protein
MIVGDLSLMNAIMFRIDASKEKGYMSFLYIVFFGAAALLLAYMYAWWLRSHV